MDSLEEKIRTIAKDVYGELGSGQSEVYQKAMEVGLRLERISFESQKVIELQYKAHYVGEEYLDLLVTAESERLVVELKAVLGVSLPEEQQLRNYLNHLGIQRGLLINFPQPSSSKKKPTEPGKLEPEFRSVSGKAALDVSSQTDSSAPASTAL
jgi:GxxExxY protein